MNKCKIVKHKILQPESEISSLFIVVLVSYPLRLLREYSLNT